MNGAGDRVTVIINMLTLCLACGFVAEHSWLLRRVSGDYELGLAVPILLPILLSSG